jgi:predicted dehydrogenase
MAAGNKRRVAVVGTGHRGAGTWGKELLATCGDLVDLVGLCDSNSLRLQAARQAIGVECAGFTDLGAMLAESRPETLVVCTRDSAHDDHIVQALEAGVDVITEKPMTTTVGKCARILSAERRTGRRIDVAFNYRFAPTARTVKELLRSGAIGDIVSVDFHWYLDVQHGTDYFRRWHAERASSGSLFVHKATHHFDLLNWYLESDPDEVFARGALVHFGRNGPFRGRRCRACEHASACDYHFDLARKPWLDMLYEAPSREDGYFRDACVFREDIDIPDTHERGDPLPQWRAGLVLAQYLHADRGLRPCLQRPSRPDRGSPPRAPARGCSGLRRSRGHAQFRRRRAYPGSAPEGRSLRRRLCPAEDAVRLARQRPARAMRRCPRRRGFGALRRCRRREPGRRPTGQAAPVDGAGRSLAMKRTTKEEDPA